MRIVSITAHSDVLCFEIEQAEPGTALRVRELAPVEGPLAGRELGWLRGEWRGGGLEIPRFDGKRDRLYGKFEVYNSREILPGVRFVTDMPAEVSAWQYPFPQARSKKGTHAVGEDIGTLGICHSTYNVNLCALFSPTPEEDTFPFECDGVTYHISRCTCEDYDRHIKGWTEQGVQVTLILLNSPKLFGSRKDPLLASMVLHPGYEDTGFISAFNMQTEDGQRYYRAYVEFLASRYTRADQKYGRACGFIINNEIDLQWDWGNAGEMPAEQYALEYLCAMRQAWLAVKKHYAESRIYVSLAQFWNTSADPAKPLRFYRGREIIELFAEYCARDGDFPWNVAYHPYPEDIRCPDFWNDRMADFSYSTRKITFKNMEVLQDYLSQPHLLYRGAQRRIIFSEQGFNSYDDYSEKQGAAGYCLAYKKIEKMQGVDAFILHAYADNPYEFGLNLGIRRHDPEKRFGEPKPIWYAFRDVDGPEGERVCAEARAFIGEEIWDRLLNPTLIHGDADRSRDNEFGAPA